MTREDFIKGVKEGTIADYEMIRYCEENILPYAKSDEERKNFLNHIIGSLLVEYITSKDTNNDRLWKAYNLINDHYENPIGDPCYGKVISWQDGHIVLKEKDQQPEPEPQQELIDLLPKQLQRDEAVNIFQKAIDAQLIEKTGNRVVWKGTKQQLAYFAEKMSEKFLLSHLDKNGNKKIRWKPFELLFNEKDLKGAKQNWMRLELEFTPNGFEKVDDLME